MSYNNKLVFDIFTITVKFHYETEVSSNLSVYSVFVIITKTFARQIVAVRNSSPIVLLLRCFPILMPVVKIRSSIRSLLWTYTNHIGNVTIIIDWSYAELILTYSL